MNKKSKSKHLKNKSKFVFAFTKLVLFGIILYYGIFVMNEGYQSALKPPPPETQPPFQVGLRPDAGPKWGDLKITMQPENAFVVGEPISTNIEIDPFLMINETATVMIVFPESISLPKEWEWANFSSQYEAPIFLHAIGDFPDDTIRQDLTLWFVHEGIFGVNITIVRFGYPEPYKEFIYPDIVHIKSYSYLEERRNAQFTNALNERIFGLTIIAVSPIAVQIVDLLKQAYDSFGVKETKGSSRAKA